jgi:DNA-binding GntR family transcriptional regulator
MDAAKSSLDEAKKSDAEIYKKVTVLSAQSRQVNTQARQAGASVKDKVGLLLNSQLICQVRRRCEVKEPVKIKNSEIESVLFPNTNGSTRTQDYYSKINPSTK